MIRGSSAVRMAVACAVLAGCAGSRSARREVLQFDPVLITAGSPEQMAIAGLNEEELFALGTSSFAAGDYAKAALCFGRLADVYLASPNRVAAQYNAGLAHSRLSQHAEALERFLAIADPDQGQGDALDAAFRAAECYYHLDRFPPAIDILTRIAAREDIGAQDKLQALVQRGICLIEEGSLDAGERALRDALQYWGANRERERLDHYFPAQAQFFLGEIYRLYFEAVALDPEVGEEKLGKDLEYKCEMLLSAQGHYLRAMRIGEGRWATAAGYRVGALYEHLYDAMLNARVPSGLDAEQAEIYREELRKKVRVLVSKAMSVYERTLAAAERIGVENPFIEKTRQSLERMKQILLVEEPASASDQAAGAPAT